MFLPHPRNNGVVLCKVIASHSISVDAQYCVSTLVTQESGQAAERGLDIGGRPGE